MNKKTVAKHIEALKGKVMTKSQIGAIVRGLNAMRFNQSAMGESLVESIEKLAKFADPIFLNDISCYATPLLFSKSHAITQEQTDLGIAWLKAFCFGARGPRKQEAFSTSDLAVIQSFKSFQFIGVLCIESNYGHKSWLPIYRTKGKSGYFDYSPIHWGKPIISGRSASK